MKQLLFILTIGLLLGCNKEESYNKRLTGNWSPVTIRVFTSGGFSYPAENIVGSLVFRQDDKSSTGEYHIKLELDYDSTHLSFNDTGNYQIIDNYVNRTTVDGLSFESKISYINKEDLDFEFRTNKVETLQIIAKKN